MSELLVDVYRYECRTCFQVFALYAPVDAAPEHADSGGLDRPCPGVGALVLFLGRTREPFPGAPPSDASSDDAG